MEVLALKEETKSLIDSFDYEQTMQVYSYVRSVGMQKARPDLQKLKEYRGKIDLDIDLDALRGRNDPR